MATAWSTRARRPLRPQARRATPTRGSSSPDDQHRARCVMGHLVRYRAEQEPLGAGHALVADHDQSRALLFGDIEDRVGGIALARERLNRFDAGLLGFVAGLLEQRHDIAVRAD